jgi:hypothetical protein
MNTKEEIFAISKQKNITCSEAADFFGRDQNDKFSKALHEKISEVSREKNIDYSEAADFVVRAYEAEEEPIFSEIEEKSK